MNVAIVGHGFSLKKAELGNCIDSHDVVVKINNAATWQNPDDHGAKTNYLVITRPQLEIAFKFAWLDRWTADIKNQLWVIDNKSADGLFEKTLSRIYCKRPYCIFKRSDVDYWTTKYLKLEPLQPLLSSGFLAILVTMHYLRPKTIHGFGFDHLKIGSNEDYQSFGYVRKTRNIAILNHDLSKERQFLPVLEKWYRTKIVWQ